LIKNLTHSFSANINYSFTVSKWCHKNKQNVLQQSIQLVLAKDQVWCKKSKTWQF